MQNDQEKLIELLVRITKRQRRLLKSYQLQNEFGSKDAALLRDGGEDMMTEDEAKTKWCPMVRLAPLGANESYRYSTNRMNDRIRGIVREARCIASDCMAWRWIDRGGSRQDGGYCGLAVKREE